MSVDNQKINILDLPNEVLREILSYIPNQLVVGEVCKTFYQISCQLNTYRLKISTEGLFFKMLPGIKNDGIYESILNSSRQIDSLYITSARITRAMNRLPLRKVLEHIGWHVKELEIRNRSFNIHVLSLLNLMPNLEKIELIKIECEELEIDDNFKLRLNKLKELRIWFCSEKILEVFDRLPDDVLHILSCKYIKRSDEERRKYFQNQRNIKHCETDHVDFFIFNQLKLKSLKVNLDYDYMFVLKGQDELTSLTVWNSILTDELLNVICTQLKLLEELELYGYAQRLVVNYEQLQNLKSLKIVYLGEINVESLKTIRSKSLVCLGLEKLNEEVCLSLSINCPNIRELKHLDYRGNIDIEKILPYFPNLEKLCTNAKILTVAKDWENQTLKHFWTQVDRNLSEMIEFLKRCKNLKTLSVGGSLQKENLKRLLMELPNLKTLCLHTFYPENAEIIKEHGQNLECIHQRSYRKREDVDKFAEVLKDHLPVCKIASNYYRKSFVLKRNGDVEKCCDFFDKIREIPI